MRLFYSAALIYAMTAAALISLILVFDTEIKFILVVPGGIGLIGAIIFLIAGRKEAQQEREAIAKEVMKRLKY